MQHANLDPSRAARGIPERPVSFGPMRSEPVGLFAGHLQMLALIGVKIAGRSFNRSFGTDMTTRVSV
jgi:hypothetical protein